jgi:hypothetical protein
MGRWKRNGNHSLPQNNLPQDSERNEQNVYPFQTPTKINDTEEPNDVLKEEILQVIAENFMEMILDTLNQNVQKALKKGQDTKNKGYEDTQKQINDLIGALNK